jgi:rod shape-determining protein MreC
LQVTRWVVLFITILIIAGMIFTTSVFREELSFLEKAVLELVRPVQELTNSAFHTVKGWIEGFIKLKEAAKENEELKAELAAIYMKQSSLLEAQRQNQALRELVDLTVESPYSLVAGEIIARSPNNWLGSITINKGRRDRIQPSQGVIAPEGVVGKVGAVTSSSAEVILLTDAQSAIGGVLLSSGDPVLVEGISGSKGNTARVKLLVWGTELKVGDQVVTSGLSSVFPKGVPIGVIEEVHTPGPGQTPYGILRPFVDLAKLEFVAVITDVSGLINQEGD